MEWSMALRRKHYCRETGNNVQHKVQRLDKKMDCLARNQVTAPDTSVTFYPRVVNKTDIDVFNEELFLLNEGMKYNVHKKKVWVTNPALETETAISCFPESPRML
jgi:hypothetical protein